MSTYNGERYLREQIDSLLDQTYKEWKLYVRDDGSKDGTVSIIKGYERKYPDKIVLLEDEFGNLGPGCSFMQLLSVVKSDYYMFCDQDDVWLSEKISVTMKKMQELESTNDDIPVLVYSDLQCVDEKLNLFPYTKWEYEHSDPSKIHNIYDLLANNQQVSGCTMMLNNISKEKVLPYKEGLMHDRWISLILYQIGGRISYISHPLILYRITGCNTVGIRKRNITHYLNKILSIKGTITNIFSYQKKLKSLPFSFNIWLYYIYLIRRISINILQYSFSNKKGVKAY